MTKPAQNRRKPAQRSAGESRKDADMAVLRADTAAGNMPALRKRKGSDQALEDGEFITEKSKDKPKEPPSLATVLLQLVVVLCSIAFVYFVALPVWHNRGVRRSFQDTAAPLQPEGDTVGSTHRNAVQDAAGRATQHLRPSLPLVITERKVPHEPVRHADDDKLMAVGQAFYDSWDAYVQDAFGTDEYNPISHTGHNFSDDGGVGYFIVDTLDMLLITGHVDGYERARDWVRELKWGDKEGKFSVFETTIRTLGGLLSAHALCTPGDDSLTRRTAKLCAPGDAAMFLQKAVTLAQHMLPAFTANELGLPLREINFMTGEGYADTDNNGMVSLAEVASIQLEFKYLAHATGDEQWWRLAERPMEVVRAAAKKTSSDGLMPIFLSPITGDAVMSEIRLGSRGDSYYEYLIKQFVQTNRSEPVYLDMYQKATTGIKKHLLRQSPKRKLLYTAEIHPRFTRGSPRPAFALVPKQDHLVCFLGGSYMLGALHVLEAEHSHPVAAIPYPPASSDVLPDLNKEDWSVGHELIKTCVDTYSGTQTGLSAEITMFRIENDTYRGIEKDWYIKKPAPKSQRQAPSEPLIDARNILRPETVESLFIAFHLSGDPIYRDWGWFIFRAFVRSARLPDGKGFAGIKDVEAFPNEIQRNDRMETFWLAETLKYLFLLFADQDILRLDQWVLNTEAHPLPIFTPTFETNVK